MFGKYIQLHPKLKERNNTKLVCLNILNQEERSETEILLERNEKDSILKKAVF